MTKKQIKLGLMLNGPGSHMNAWKAEDVQSDASVNVQHYIDITKRAEASGFAFVFVADGLYINSQSSPHFLNRFEPLTILSALASVTERIGLVGTLSTTYSEPYTVARQFASLDQLSGGRAGWNVVTSPLEGSAENFHKGNHPVHALRYEKAEEHVDVVQGLWNSWGSDAFLRNKQTGKFFDPAKLHTLNHQGKYFSVKGPLNISKSAQGEPVIFQAGASETGRAFASRKAEVIFNNPGSLASAQAYYQDIKDRVEQTGRDVNPQIFASVTPILGETIEAAEEIYQQLQALVTVDEALAYLGRYFDHYDFTKHSLDEPFPELADIGQNSFQSVTNQIKADAKQNNLTLRQVALKVTTPRSEFFGTYNQVAEKLIYWIDNQAADGFIVTVPVFNKLYDTFLTEVIPILKARGYYNEKAVGKTLRDQLEITNQVNSSSLQEI